MKITSINPCVDWFYVESTDASVNKPMPYRLAAWGIAVDDHSREAIIGLVPVSARQTNGSLSGLPQLVPVPATGGCYKHVKDLTVEERLQLDKRSELA